jgi:uncharacterized phage protein gp47/JayE
VSVIDQALATLASLPPPSYIATADPSTLLTQYIQQYQDGWKKKRGNSLTLGDADPRKYHLNFKAAVDSQNLTNLQLQFDQTFLATATGSNLDLYGTRFEDRGRRLTATSATTTLQFSKSLTSDIDAVIPPGTTASTTLTSGQVATFKTTVLCTISAGQLSATASAECTAPGSFSNNIVPNSINTLNSQSLPSGVTSVTNTTITTGGSDGESDAHYRARLYYVPRSFGTGTKQRYIFQCLSYNPSVTDVATYDHESMPGKVWISFLMNETVPSNNDLKGMQDYVMDDSRRTLATLIQVFPPVVNRFTLTAKYSILSSNRATGNSVMQSVNNAVQKYLTDASETLGQTIVLSQIITAATNAGAYDFQIISPTTDINQSWNQISIGTATLNFTGYVNG